MTCVRGSVRDKYNGEDACAQDISTKHNCTNQNAVGVGNGVQPMGYSNHCAVSEVYTNRFLD